MRKIACVILSMCLAWGMCIPVEAVGKETGKSYASRMIQYYRHHQAAAEDVIWDLQQQMAEVDPDQAAVWKNIMDDWAWVNEEMPVGMDILPDGLPEDESLCIVVLGYALTEDGYMREELVNRLVVALSSALKYPNALIAVTGGQTSEAEGVTEAGLMASWLKKKGIDSSRILVENQALNTTANVENVYMLLNEQYPQIKSVAVITSDYHLTWGSALFAAMSNYNFGYNACRPIDVVAGAMSYTGKIWDTMTLQAAGISHIAGLAFDEGMEAPALYPVERPTEPAVEPEEDILVATTEQLVLDETEVPLVADVQTVKEKSQLLPAVGIVLALIVWIFLPKKPRKKRKKPEFKWED